MDAVDWTEIQTLICVVKTGSLSAAARELRVNHSTILRRIQSFENKHHLNVFVREANGYRLSKHGRALMHDFERIDEVMLGLQRRIQDYDDKLKGKLTLTSTESLFASFLKQPIFEFAQSNPAVELDLLISNQLVNMSQLEADVAVRPAEAVPEGFFGEYLFEFPFHFYGTHEISERFAGDSAQAMAWIGFSGAIARSRVGLWLASYMRQPPVITVNSFDGVAMAAQQGLGAALLPKFIGEAAHGLKPLAKETYFSTKVFAMAPNELMDSRRVKAMMSHLKQSFI